MVCGQRNLPRRASFDKEKGRKDCFFEKKEAKKLLFILAWALPAKARSDR
jgi:hypothetical protein